MIEIALNKELDSKVYQNFCDLKIAGADFAALIKRDHPNILPENAEQYIDNFYNENKTVLEQSCDELLVALNEKQEMFFEALKKLFKTDFKSNSYKGYVSIFDFNPRFIETNEFQVFYKRNIESKLSVVFHEVLHFAFFDYCDIYFTEKIKDLDKNSGKLWELSEIFNVIVLNTPQFVAITSREEKIFYPQLTEKLEQAKIVWDKVGKNINKFIDEML